MRRALIAALIALAVALALPTPLLAQPQRQLTVRVSGAEVEGLRLVVWLNIDGQDQWQDCVISSGVCTVDVKGSVIKVRGLTVVSESYAVVRVEGTHKASWTRESQWHRKRDKYIRLQWTEGRVEASFEGVSPRLEGDGLVLSVEVRRACVVAVDVSSPLRGIQPPHRAERDRVNVVVPEGEVDELVIGVKRRGVGISVAGLADHGVVRVRWGWGGWEPFTVPIGVQLDCSMRNVTLEYLIARNVREGMEQRLARERSLLQRVGLSAELYLRDAELAVFLLKESERALKSGEREAGRKLLGKGLEKAASALDDLSAMKSDSVHSFFLLILFTFFLSLIVGSVVEGERGLLVAPAVLVALFVAELALLPYARLALTLLSSMNIPMTSLIVGFFKLLLIGAIVLGAGGTVFSDLFWYSVRSMKRRKLRALLTVVTIAAVTAAAHSFLAFGSIRLVREESYQTGFRGVSVSRHVTTSVLTVGVEGSRHIVTEEYVPLELDEVKWLLFRAPWVKRLYLVLGGVSFVASGSSEVRALIVATNATAMRGVALSASLAKRLNVTVGSTVVVGGARAVVELVFDDPSPPLLVDGIPLLELAAELPIVVAPLELAPAGSQVYRVILEGDPPLEFADWLVEMGYVRRTSTTSNGAEVFTHVYESYRVCESRGGRARCRVIIGEFVQASGAPEFTLVIALSAMVVAISLLGSTFERGREYSTVSALGASPRDISAIVAVEGLSYGILGGVAGYVFGQILQVLMPSVVAVRPLPLSSVIISMLVAIVPSLLGSLVPARSAVLKVVPSRVRRRGFAEFKLYKGMAEMSIPLRITGDAEEFAKYVMSLTERPPVGWAPTYVRVDVRRRDGAVELVEALVSSRSTSMERGTAYLVKIHMPKRPGEVVRVVVTSHIDQWTAGHTICLRDFLTSLRNDLLGYVEWKKARFGAQRVAQPRASLP